MRKSIRSARRRPARRGFTLLEVLVATAVTLLMMVSLAQVFKVIGDSMKQGRAALQMNNTLRSVSFRLRHDLNNLTVRVDPPADASTGSGYFEYFDGAMTDSTATLFDPKNTYDPELTTSMVRSSRFGDLDDVLMFTARAGDSWFIGRVPAFVLNPTPAFMGGTTDTDSDGILDQYESVMISSQLAEIVVFARPVLSGISTNTYFDDVDGNGLPDAYQLYYRALLIRPDLNVNGVLPSTGSWLVAGPNNSSSNPPSYIDMAPVHQQCDLSVRRVNNGSTDPDSVAANSLDDLMDPANRFAHVQQRASSASTTMPLLALQPIPQTVLTVFSDDGNSATVSPLYSEPDPAGPMAGVVGNFIAPEFTLGFTVAPGRRGEDILASDVLAFDVKAFDSGVPVLGMNGPNGTDDGAVDGSDDVILTPNDPGYAAALVSPTPVGYGAYVDLMWGRKTLCSLPYFGLGITDVSSSANLVTELSGLQPSSAGLIVSDGMLRSGKAIYNPNSPEPLILMQPTFDTWTTRYENDGNVQAALVSSEGIVDVDGFKRRHDTSLGSDSGNIKDTIRQTATDAGTDGIDNNGSGGTDEAAELETQPPFPVKLRGIKVSIRVEDRATRQVRQMSVANEFVTQ